MRVRNKADAKSMDVSRLDFLFPFLVFFYGFLLLSVLEIPTFSVRRTALTERLMQHLEPKRKFAWLCLGVGAFWSLQNLLFT